MDGLRLARLFFVTVMCCGLVGALIAEEFRSFPNFSSPADLEDAAASRLPLSWTPKESRWRVELEGYGQSCPCVFKNHAYVTTVVGSQKETCQVTCVDIENGNVLWTFVLDSSFPEASTPMISRAAPTPVCDERGVTIFFESGDLIALDHSGNKFWQRSLQKEVGPFLNKFGLSSTPVQTPSGIVLLLDHSDESSLICIDKKDGKTNWLAPRGKRLHSWSSPGLIRVDNKPMVVCSSAGTIDVYDPVDGKRVCTKDDIGGNSVATPYDLGDGRFLISSLIRPADGPSKNATTSNLLARVTHRDTTYDIEVEWIAEEARGSFCSPIEHRGYCYWINPQGILFCLEAKSGKQMYSKRLSCGSCWATPFAAGDRIYLFGKEGAVNVIQSGAEYRELATDNRIWDKESSRSDESRTAMMSGPVLYGAVSVGNGFLIRRGDALYRVDKISD
jgi:hypothetical protein